jgi:DNA-binding Lrp family transcriptional regulator
MTRTPSPKDKHYRLTNEEWVQAVHELKESEKDLLYYLRTLDPFGDRPLNLGVREVAKTLNCSPSTVSRALKVLDKAGYIDMEMVTVQVKILSKSQPPTSESDPPTPEPLEPNDSEEVLRPRNSVPPTQQTMHPRNKQCTHATNNAPTQQTMHPRNNRPPEPRPVQDFKTSHTIQTLNTIQTLSNSTGGSEFFEINQEQGEQRKYLESVGQIISSKVQLKMIPTDTVEDKSSAPATQTVENNNLPLGYEHSTMQMEQKYQLGGVLPSWRTGRGYNDLHPDFVEWIRRWLNSIPPERDRSRGDAIAYIRKQEKAGATNVLDARAEEWLLATQKAQENQKQQQHIANQTILTAVNPSLPEDYEETRANLRRINQLIQQHRHQPPAQSLEPSAPTALPETLDYGDLLTRLSIQRRRLGWDLKQIRQWFLDTFGQTSDRLDDEQLLDAVISLEGLAPT